MVMGSTVKVVFGSFAFAVFWVLAVFPAVPFMPIGRTAGSLLGAMLMVLFQVISPEDAYTAIDLPILGLLFGTMVVSIYLERADMFQYLGKLLSWKTRGAKDLLCRVCVVSAVCSALFTNDTSCVVLTEFVLKIARQKNLPPQPFLLALASSANIGSAATPIGNPQNLVIAVLSKITFGGFLVGILPAMLAGMCVNAAILLIMYWKLLSIQKDEEDVAMEVVAEEDMNSHRFSPATMSHLNSQELPSAFELPSANAGHLAEAAATLRNRSGILSEDNSARSSPMSSVNGGHTDRDCSESVVRKVERGEGLETNGDLDVPKEIESPEALSSKMSSAPNAVNGIERDTPLVGEGFGFSKKWTRSLWKTSVYVVTLGMLISLLMGLNMSWVAITAALTLIILDFKDARPSLEKVSYSLLLFFCGMFITVDGFNKTGIPSTVWELMEPYAQIDQISGTTVLTLVILVLSNVASNVPTVLLLGVRVVASASAISPSSERKAWLILAWVSTVGGNLSLLGSAANLIVCEQARRAEHLGYNLSFWSHLKFGIPSTILVTAVGMVLIRG